MTLFITWLGFLVEIEVTRGSLLLTLLSSFEVRHYWHRHKRNWGIQPANRASEKLTFSCIQQSRQRWVHLFVCAHCVWCAPLANILESSTVSARRICSSQKQRFFLPQVSSLFSFISLLGDDDIEVCWYSLPYSKLRAWWSRWVNVIQSR